jgi:hypothetical protein
MDSLNDNTHVRSIEYRLAIPSKAIKNNSSLGFKSNLSYALKVVGLCVVWMFLNLSCTFFNSIMFTKVGWHFPILLTLSHGWICAIYYLFFTKVGAAKRRQIKQ